MNREFSITALKTYANKDNVRKAIAKTGDECIRHAIIQNGDGRFFPVFFPTEEQISETGIHHRWNIIY